jgi:hypothetical protein
MSIKSKIGAALGKMALEVATEAAKSFVQAYGQHAANAAAAKRWPAADEGKDSDK